MATTLTSESAVLKALRQRFPAPAWAMLAGVGNGTGGRADRWADAVAMSVWPSRGLEIHGFEIKVNRGDFLRELKQPRKAEAVGQYCDRWWIAAGSKKIARPEELPPAWGLLVPHGKTMKIIKDAGRTDAAQLNRTFVAAVLRRASEAYDVDAIRSKILRELKAEAYAEAQEAARRHCETEMELLRDRESHAREELYRVQRALLNVTEEGYAPGVMREAIGLLSKLRGWQGLPNRIAQVQRIVAKQRELLGEAEQNLGEVEALYEKLAEERE